MSLFKIFDVAGSGMAAQGVRLNVTASNLANAGSVASSAGDAYRAKNPIFAAVQQNQLSIRENANIAVRVDRIVENNRPIAREYQPGNPMANEDGFVFLSNVKPIEEMVNMMSASRSFQNNIEIMNTTKELMLRTLTMGQ